jgi:hypothetical protein
LLVGNEGDDYLDSGDGLGFDNTSYASARSAVTVDLAMLTVTGATSGTDRLGHVDRVTGTKYDDVSRALTDPTTFKAKAARTSSKGGTVRTASRAGGGDDTIYGGGWHDHGWAGPGDDFCRSVEVPHSCER